ncbi:ribonuclease T2 family protein [Neorhizobium sp. NPDC001467]|uniref:ribonuclease T2 family protein n=1 Tax=Neorhizobium sp. NPDC001467 TaxID=3390595 RepID=UPI003CFD09D6
MTGKLLSALGHATLAMAVLCCVLLPANATFAQENNQSRNQARGQAGVFDFYVLSLSWSPTFCAAQKSGRNAQQCGSTTDFGFIVHGLWPQYERGYPEFCKVDEPGRVPNALGEPLFDIMPSMGLIGHQWRKHGACSGLSQRDYLAAIRTAYQRVKLPVALTDAAQARTLSARAVEEAFVESNPGMDAKGIAVTCERDKLEEVRICMTKDFAFRPCAEVDRRSCSLTSLTLPAAP